MTRRINAAFTGLAVGALVTGLVASPAVAKPNAPTSTPAANEGSVILRDDSLSSPLSERQDALRKEAISQVLRGKVTPIHRNGSEVVKIDNQWVELQAAPQTDPVFTILVEFGTLTKPTTGGSAGPSHNQIPEPDRVYDGNATDDNTTLWTSDFSQSYYQDMLFGDSGESFADFYLKQSSGQFTVDGDVTAWVTVPYNESRYGSNAISSASGYWNFVKDSAAAWYDSQIAAGKTAAEIGTYLSQFDVWDRYDHDGDGDFNEPDGYIDHFQVIHAGEGEEAGGGAQGDDAIWSHRWYAFSNGVGSTGPAGNLLGGVAFGASGIWAGDYTTEPENGGLGVFTHEFGHDLGLPDLYDTDGGDNGTAFWTLMSGGSWMSNNPQDIGSSPIYMGPWEKLFLGWLDYAVVDYGSKKTVTLGAAGATDGKLPQAVVVTLPDQEITTEYVTPYAGSYEWWGGSADDLNNSMTKTIDLTGVTTATVGAKAWFDIEEDYDYLYSEVSTDGTSWTALPESHIDSGQGETGIDGTSDGWVDLSYDLSAYAGQSVQFRFRYATDGGVHYDGPFLDNITVTTDGTATTDADDSDAGWTANGFTRFTGSVTTAAPHFYLAENRQYVGYDANLKVGPYNFSNLAEQGNWAERFPYQAGLLVWYVNYAYEDNNTIDHPGYGLALPIDARAAAITFPSGVLLGNRRQPFDATFGLQKTDTVTFHRSYWSNGAVVKEQVTVPSSKGISTFTDSDPLKYWSAANPLASAQVAGAGVKIQIVTDIRGGCPKMVLKVSFS